MASDDMEDGEDRPVLGGPGVYAWLERTLGPPRRYKGNSVTLPDPFSRPVTVPARRYDISLDDLLKTAEDGKVGRIEMRDVPDRVELSAGSSDGNGVWSVPAKDVTGLSARVPADVAVPFTVTTKAVFENDADGSSWTEVAGLQIGADGTSTAGEPREPSTPAVSPHSKPVSAGEAAPEPIHAGFGPEMSIIDLDVSVGIDDPDILAGIVVSFEGLPNGTFLTAGRPSAGGTWEVTADHLQALSIVSPLGAPDFELNVTLDSGGAKPQSAVIEVTNDDDAASDDQSPVQVGFRHAPDGEAVRLMIFTDGMLAYDRAVMPDQQGPDAFTVGVPFEDGLPFELVVRHVPLISDEAAGPVFESCRADGIEVNTGHPGIDMRAADHPGTWHGDLVIDMGRALRTELAASGQSEAGMAVQSADRPADLPRPAGTATEIETEPAEQITEGAPGFLRVNASLEDVANDSFLAELRRLRDFVRAHADDTNKAIYSRLGLDVAKWNNMEVVGPLGAPVDLDPMLPKLASPGGRDNTRAPQKMGTLRIPSDISTIRVAGLSPGALLTAGNNVGGGSWELAVEDLADVRYVAPCGQRATTSLQVETADGDRRMLGTLIVTAMSFSLRPERQGMTSIPLDLDPSVFDPEGYGALSLTLGDVPAGIMLSLGSNHGDGVWTAELKTGARLGVCVRSDGKPFDVTLTCIAMNSENGESTVVTRRMSLSPRSGTCQLADGLAA